MEYILYSIWIPTTLIVISIILYLIVIIIALQGCEIKIKKKEK